MTVYVIQDQKHVCPKTSKLVSKFNFEPASAFGELVYLLKPGASPFDLPPVLERMHDVLSGFTDVDFLLLTGSPILIGLAVSIAAAYNDGRVTMLQWSGAKQAYVPVSVRGIFEVPGDIIE